MNRRAPLLRLWQSLHVGSRFQPVRIEPRVSGVSQAQDSPDASLRRPDGWGTSRAVHRAVMLARRMGPTAIESSIGTSSVCRSLPARNERGGESLENIA